MKSQTILKSNTIEIISSSRILLPILLLGLLLGLLGISHPLHVDESYSVLLTNGSFSNLISRLQYSAHPPAYMVLLTGWRAVVGESETALRCLSLLFYLLTITAVYYTGISLYGQTVAWVASVFYAVSPLAISQAKFLRPYSLLSLVCVLSTVFLLQICSAKRLPRSRLALYLLCLCVGTFTHYWFFFVIFAHAVLWVSVFRCRFYQQVIPGVVFSLLPFLALWLPILKSQLVANPASWLPTPGVGEFFTILLEFYGGSDALLLYAAVCLLVVVRLRFNKSIVPNISFKVPRAQRSKYQILQLILLIVVMLATPIVVSQIVKLYFIRYTVIALFALSLVLGIVVARFVQPSLLLPFILSLVTTVVVLEARSKLNEPNVSDKKLASFLAEKIQPGDTIVATSLSIPGLRYYLRRFGQIPDVNIIGFPREIELHPAWRNQEVSRQRHSALNREAKKLVSTLHTKPQSSSIWLLYGNDLEISAPVAEQLIASFTLQAQHRVAGDWSTQVFEFQGQKP